MKALGFKQTITFAMVLLVSGCLLVANIISYQSLKQDTIGYVQRSSQSVTHYEANNISMWFKSKATAIAAIAERYKQGHITGQFVDIARLSQQANQLYSVFWGFDDGSSHASVEDDDIWHDGIADPTQYDPRPRGWYRLAKANQRPVLTGIYTDMVTKQPVISIVTNLGDGVLSGDIGLTILGDTVNQVNFPGAVAAIVDAKGKVLASADWLEVGTSLTDAGLSHLQRAIVSSDSYSGEYADGEQTYLAFSEAIALLGEQKWYLVISVDEQVAYAELESAFTKALWLSIGMVLVSAALLIAILHRLYQPITELKQVVLGLSQGQADLTRRLPVNREDDLGDIALGINQFVANLQGLLKQVSQETDSINHSISQLYHRANENNHVLGQHVGETQQVVTAVEEMSATASDVATNTSQASQAAVITNQQVANTNTIVINTQQTVSQLIRDVEQTEANIGCVEQDAASITQVLQVIGDIAEQTNLLALNAAIEAARAGEQGRGFAVVADEVRALAGRTQISTTEIEQTLAKLKQGIHGVVESMQQTKLTCEQASETTQEMSTNLDQVVESIVEVSNLNTQIATATEQQSAVTEEVNRNMNTIAGMVEMLQANGQASDLETKGLAQANNKLKDVVSRFTLD